MTTLQENQDPSDLTGWDIIRGSKESVMHQVKQLSSEEKDFRIIKAGDFNLNAEYIIVLKRVDGR